MKRAPFFLLLIPLLFLLREDTATSVPALDLPALPGQILARFQPGTSPEEIAMAAERTSSSLLRRVASWDLYLFVFPEGIPIDEMLARFRACPGVLQAEPNQKIPIRHELNSNRESAWFAGRIAGDRKLIAFFETAFPRIDRITKVKLFTNEEETPRDHLDNDQNGYVDDVQGYDFYTRSPNTQGGNPAARACTQNIIRHFLRGSPDRVIRLMPVRVGTGSWIPSSTFCEAVSYAIQQKADLFYLGNTEWWRSPLMVDALHRTARHQILLVATAADPVESWASQMSLLPPVLWLPDSEQNLWDRWFLKTIHWFSDRENPVRLDLRSAVQPAGRPAEKLINHDVLPASGKIREAARFIGQEQQFLSIPNRLIQPWLNGSFSISLWSNFDSIGGHIFHRCLLSKGSFSNVSFALYTENRPGNLRILIREHATKDFMKMDSEPLSPGKWYYVAMVYDFTKKTVAFYINGVFQGDIPATGGLFQNSSPLEIGRIQGESPPAYMDGRIDELAIWNRTLEGEEIAELYNQGMANAYDAGIQTFSLDSKKTLTRNLVLYYPFNEAEPPRPNQTTPGQQIFATLGGLVFLFSLIRGLSLHLAPTLGSKDTP